MLWECPKLKDARLEGDKDLEQLKLSNLPPSLKIGIPPMLPAGHSEFFWDFDDRYMTPTDRDRPAPPTVAGIQGEWKMHEKATNLLNQRSSEELLLMPGN